MASPDRLKEPPVSPDRVEKPSLDRGKELLHNQSLSLTEPTNSPDRVKEPHVSPDRVEEPDVSLDRVVELRLKLETTSIGSKSVDAYLEEMRHLREDLGDLGFIVEHDDFVNSVMQGLGSNYFSVQDEVLFHDAAPCFEKIRRYVLRRQSILQGAADERPIYICSGCGQEQHVDISFDVLACRSCHCDVLLKKRRRAIIEYQSR